MNTFKAELKKLGILLAIGGGLLIIINLYFSIKGGCNLIIQLLDPSFIIFNMICILYPIGMVYGWDKAKAMWQGNRRKSRYGEFQNIGYDSFTTTVTKVVATIIFTIIIAPIIGVIKAIKTLIEIKRTSD